MWSPDGKWIAYFSDKSGEYEIYVRAQDGSGDEKRVTTDGHAYRFGPAWSPDSTKIVFAEKTMKLFYVDINSGKPVLIDQGRTGVINSYDWSPDGKWILYQVDGQSVFTDNVVFDRREEVISCY
jgi:tricorn protease